MLGNADTLYNKAVAYPCCPPLCSVQVLVTLSSEQGPSHRYSTRTIKREMLRSGLVDLIRQFHNGYKGAFTATPCS